MLVVITWFRALQEQQEPGSGSGSLPLALPPAPAAVEEVANLGGVVTSLAAYYHLSDSSASASGALAQLVPGVLAVGTRGGTLALLSLAVYVPE